MKARRQFEINIPPTAITQVLILVYWDGVKMFQTRLKAMAGIARQGLR